MGTLYTDLGVEPDDWFIQTLHSFQHRLCDEFPGSDEDALKALLQEEMLARLDDETYYAGPMLLEVFEEALEATKTKVRGLLTN